MAEKMNIRNSIRKFKKIIYNFLFEKINEHSERHTHIYTHTHTQQYTQIKQVPTYTGSNRNQQITKNRIAL